MKTIIVLFLFCSCSLFRGSKNIDEEKHAHINSIPTKKDYIDQLASLGDILLELEDIKFLRLNRDSEAYLVGIYNKIVNSNEVILKKRSSIAKFYIIESKHPFYFSLPKSQFFLSSGLLKKYVKTEGVLISILSHEILKSINSIYKKTLVVPTGFLTIEKVLSLTKIDLKEKMNVNKWTYFALRRAGYDPIIYLNWIQIQNKNTLDFTYQLGSSAQISKEEFLFKTFLSSVKDSNIDYRNLANNSSKGFYSFISKIKRM